MSLYVDIEKRYGKFHLKMKFESGNEVIALLGASGCGKSLTLKCIAGIETPDRGRIMLDDQVLFDSEKKINLPPQKRKVGYLFQQYALFPNMTVFQNVMTGVRKENAKGAPENIVQEMIEAMGLLGMEQKYPHQLSGGQQQRVALARILVNEPNILLLDEPFSALDSHLRFRLEQQVRDIIHQFGKSVVLVSHNRDEVFRLSDKIAIVSDGKIETVGGKQEVFSAPATKNAAILTGCKNVSSAKWIDEQHVFAIDWNMTLKVKEYSPESSYVGIRMKYIRPGEEGGENAFRCNVIEEVENPFSYTIMLAEAKDPGEMPIGWELLKEDWKRVRADHATIQIPPESILLLKE